MAEAVISVAVEEAVRPLVDSTVTQLGYIWNYRTNFSNLNKQTQKLQGRRVALEHSINEARNQGEEIEQHVLIWLDSVEKMNEEAIEIIDDINQASMLCFKNMCPDLKKRYQHSKKASVKAMEVSELEKEGKFDKISFRTPPKETWHPSSKPFEDFESRRSTVENILNELRNPSVNMVGVYGMGGIGKTTLAKEVGKQAEEQRLFDVVVFVEVTEKPDILKIQEAIADKLGLEFREKSESGRARALCERMKKDSRILLILDNIWKGLDLEIVGISFGNEHRGCKLLLTARSIDVLSNDMDCRNNFPVCDLHEKEAWDLFKMAAGACIEKHNLHSLAFDVAKRCGGLPIAIVTIAKALKDKQEHEWKNALRELKRPSSESLVGSVTSEAYSCIRLSYNHLNSEELKSIFLLCSIMGFTSKASIEELLRYGMGLRLFRTVYTMEEARDKVDTLVKKLKDSSLLLDTSDSVQFSIHDVVRDVGIAIAFKDYNKFTVIDGIIPREWKDKNILRQCTSISLHDITELPNIELDCPLLKFLYMKGKSDYSKIPDNFFIGMPNLGVLHLIKMELSPLPPSIRCLVNLQTLCLYCSCLGDISLITNMNDLEILVLWCNSLEQLPTEIGQLTQLRVLDLRQCYALEVIPPSIISKLTQLEELYLGYEFDNWHVEGLDNESGNASLDELKHLFQLTTLQIRIRDHKIVPKDLFSQKLQRYNICIGIDQRDCKRAYGTSKTLKLKSNDNICVKDGVITQLKGIEELFIDGGQGVKDVLYEELCLDSDGFPKLKHFVIRNNPGLVYIVDLSKKWELSCDAFPLLETLSLTHLISLEKICHGQLTPNTFCRLRTVNVDECDNLKNVFSLSIAKHLSQLEDITVRNCKNMEDIFTIGRRNDISSNEEIGRVVLDQLHSLSLRTLPNLRIFCSEAEVFASTSNEIILEDTPMPFFNGKVQLPNLKTLNLFEVNFEKTWHHQLPILSPCFQNLTHLKVWSCHNLKYLFSSSTLGSFVKLQDLDIGDCKELEAIIRIDELGNNVEHPSLKKLYINICPEIKAFIFNDKVSFPNLEEIRILYMKNLEMIWQNQLTKDSMNAQNCCKVNINSCKSLKKLFPPSIASNLFQLKDLYVEKCGIEEIVAKEGAKDAAARTFVFPHLTCLTLHDLQELKCFYPGVHTIEWPVLKKLKLIGCDKMDHLFALELFTFQKNTLAGQLDISIQPLSLVKKVFSNLEKLSLDGNSTRMIFQSQFPEIFFPKLELLDIQNQNDQPADLPLGFLQRFHNLQSLSLEGGSNKEILWFEVVGKHTPTKKLSILSCKNLEQIWKQDSKVDVILLNFEELYVGFCDSLVTVIPPSACFQNLTILIVTYCGGLLRLLSSSTAKSLVGLKKMGIRSCHMMTKVVADEEGAITEDEIINFSKLKSLELVNLSKLTSFCSWNYTLNFPSLERLSVENCPKMKIFSSGAVITPMLREIQLDNKGYYFEGDVNTTMQQIHENLVFSGKRLSLSPRDIKMILQKLPEHQFSKLKSLAVFDDESTVFPFGMIQRFHYLEKLLLTDSSYKEIFTCEEVEKHAETLAQLKSLYLNELDNLEQMWKQDSKLDLILHNLETLKVWNCNILITLMPTSASFQNLKSLEVRSCNGLISLLSSSTAKSLVQLEDMSISYCNMMTKIVATEDVEEDKIIIFSKLRSLTLVDLSSLASFCSGNHTLKFPSLKRSFVIKCPKMKFFSSVVSSTPLFQGIQFEFDKSIWEGDLNATIQRIHEELVGNKYGDVGSFSKCSSTGY